MTCICRIVKCRKCLTKMKPKHTMKDERRYCSVCGYNIGMKKCQGD